MPKHFSPARGGKNRDNRRVEAGTGSLWCHYAVTQAASSAALTGFGVGEQPAIKPAIDTAISSLRIITPSACPVQIGHTAGAVVPILRRAILGFLTLGVAPRPKGVGLASAR